MREFKNIASFYAIRGGAKSIEYDFGGCHRWGQNQTEVYRVSVVAETGDVYAEAQYGRRVILIGTFGPPPLPKNLTDTRHLDWVSNMADKAFAEWESLYLGVGRTLTWFEERMKGPGKDVDGTVWTGP